MAAFKIPAAEGSFVQYSRQEKMSGARASEKCRLAKEKLPLSTRGDHPLQDVEHFFVRLQGTAPDLWQPALRR